MKSDIVIGGVGMVPFRKPGQSESYDLMGEKAVNSALHDAGIPYSLVEQAFCGYVYGDSCAGQAALYRVDISGIPVFNVNNNCASGSSAFALAVQAIESGQVECALALGFGPEPESRIRHRGFATLGQHGHLDIPGGREFSLQAAAAGSGGLQVANILLQVFAHDVE